MTLLQEEASLQEIVRLVGIDALGSSDRLKLLVAQMIREDYLHQNAFHEVDTYSSLNKQFQLMKMILTFNEKGKEAIQNGIHFKQIDKLPIREKIGRFKYVKETDVNQVAQDIHLEMMQQFESLVKE
jgi:V/A-type H+-transporting ATPase subunit A